MVSMTSAANAINGALLHNLAQVDALGGDATQAKLFKNVLVDIQLRAVEMAGKKFGKSENGEDVRWIQRAILNRPENADYSGERDLQRSANLFAAYGNANPEKTKEFIDAAVELAQQEASNFQIYFSEKSPLGPIYQ
jgi:GrpB-like predicted nucleotidyltransferase (UPF0157 family)